MLEEVATVFGPVLQYNATFVISCADNLPAFSEWDAAAKVCTQ